jgi:Tol biopolymer transport system component
MSAAVRSTLTCALGAMVLAACSPDGITAPGVAVAPDPATSKQGPSGARILFNVGEGLYSMDDDGTNIITVLAEDAYAGASWTADGKQILFSHKINPIGLHFAIYVMNDDGTGLTQLTHPPENYADFYPRTVGKLVVFERSYQLAGTFQIWIFDPATGMETQLTPGPSDTRPAGSPSGKLVVFARAGDIYVYDLASTAVTRLTFTEGLLEGNPAWSPGGKLIAYSATDITDSDYPSDIYVMNADGSNVTQLTKTPTQLELSPVWSPDGKQLAFTRYLGGNTSTTDVWVMELAYPNPAMNITPGTSETSERVQAWTR